MNNLIKKYYFKFFYKKKYLELKRLKQIDESVILFKQKYEKHIYDIRKKINENHSLSFLHSGNLGDLIYSLPVIKELSKSHKCYFYIKINEKMPTEYYKHPAKGFYIDERMLKLFLPLMQAQKYISEVKKFEGEKIDIDLNLFRKLPINICFNSPRWYFHITGIQVDLTEPYLDVTEHNSVKNKIIIHRTFRHRNQFINYKFLRQYLDLVFIGNKDEYDDLKLDIPDLKLYNCNNFLEMAQIIKSSKFFIGNQSIAYPMAEALKIPRLLEAEPQLPIVQPIGQNGFDFYYQPDFEKYVKYLNEKK